MSCFGNRGESFWINKSNLTLGPHPPPPPQAGVLNKSLLWAPVCVCVCVCVRACVRMLFAEPAALCAALLEGVR